MTTSRPVRLPVASYEQFGDFVRAGFRFRDYDAGDPLFRCAWLPSGWIARCLYQQTPVEIVDQYRRTRVRMVYSSLPVLQRDGSTGLKPIARMRLIPAREYIVRAVAAGHALIPDDTWATSDLIHQTAVEEALRALRTAREFRDQRQEKTARHYDRLHGIWSTFALAHTRVLETAA